MLRLIRFAVLTVVTLFLVGAGANVLYVQSSKAKIMKSASFKGKVVVTVKKGEKLQMLSKKGRWYEVKVNGKKGWVRNLLVSKRPPIKKVSLFAKKRGQKDISSKARRRASVRTTAAAARGLAEDDRRRVGAEMKIDYAAMERVETFAVTDAEVDIFVENAQ